MKSESRKKGIPRTVQGHLEFGGYHRPAACCSSLNRHPKDINDAVADPPDVFRT